MHMPEPIVDRADGTDPEHEALLADSVGLALLVVLETLTPPERLAFVLHDIFAVPFDEIAPIVDRSPEAARQLASRARRRVQGEQHGSRRRPRDASARSSTRSSRPRARATSRRWSRCSTRTSCCAPTSVPRADRGRSAGRRRSPARRAVYSQLGLVMQPALVNGAAGAVSMRDGEPFSVGAFTVRAARSSRSTSSPTRSGCASST